MKAVLTTQTWTPYFSMALIMHLSRVLMISRKENMLLIDSSPKPAPILLLAITANRKLCKLFTKKVLNYFNTNTILQFFTGD